ncbi:uncharacterized protein [Populus alba]|uniref:uncharacterized protein n=1 Tax=Populus alba TaxID=43335 RepID=UPI00158BAA7C|nr:uncharacterized protein LOC118041896 [Populus alba]
MDIATMLWVLFFPWIIKAPSLRSFIFFDTDNEVSNRLQPFCNENFQSSLDSDIVVGLINMLDSSNQLVRLFRHARQRLGDVEVPELKLRLIGKRDDDSRQYDDPSLNDIGGLVVGDIGHCRSDRDIIIESLSGTLQRISKLHPKFMSLHYPLLFPYGEDGFHTDIPLAHQEQQPPKKRQKVSMRAYYAYLIHEREKQESTLIKGGRLYQQFLVDAFVNVEEERLDFIRANQENLRSEHYKGIHDAIARGDTDGSTTGKNYTSIVFNRKPSVYDVCAVEFQKRGLPHTHLLVWLAPEFKFRSPEDVDSIISAEIPDKHQDPICFEIVSKFMMHGPCGAANPKAQYSFVHMKQYGVYSNSQSIQGAQLLKDFKSICHYNTMCFFQVINPYRQFLGDLALIRQCSQSGLSATGLMSMHEIYFTHSFQTSMFGMLGKKEWIVRSRGFCLGRIVYVHPAAGELYFLRMLLNHVKGAKSFEDLRQISGTIFPTFQLACKALGLLGDDKRMLEQLFNASGTSLEDHKLPMPNGRLMDEVRNKLLREELSYDLAELRNNHSLAMPLLNPCQRNIYDSERLFLWHTIINRVRSEGSIVLAVASSGIASLLLPGGRTAHSRFKIPLEVNESSTCEIKHNTHLSRLLEMTSLIVWDEAPMNNRFCFEALDRSLRDVLRLNNPFGGKSVLLGGDFRQILPVIPGGTKEEIINASFTSSLLWSAFTFLTLNQNMRLSAEGLSPDQKDELRQFAEWILLIGDGQICDLAVSDDHDAAFIKIPCELQVEVIDSPIAAIVSAIYPDIERAHLDPFYFKDRAIVTPKNLTVSEINNFILDIIPGHKYNFLSCDSIQTTSGDIDNIDLLYPIEFINQLDFNGVPQHSISLKIGTPIMLLRNLSPSAGLCNGTRLIVTQLAERIIEAQIITGSNIGDRVFIPRIVFPVNDKKCPFTIKRRQFPIRPCYAMTINKSQGQSLKIVGVFLKEQVFSHGQLYVALSRVTSKNGLKIISLDHEGKPSCYAKNIVYKDIIQLLPKE